MLVPLADATGHAGKGDFTRSAKGQLARFQGGGQVPMVNTGAQIIKTGLFADVPENRFSQNIIWDRLIANERLFGCIHSGGWADVGTPEGLLLAENMLRAK